MATLDERDVAKHLFNPFAVWITAVGDNVATALTGDPSYFTDPGMTFSFPYTFVEQKAYNACSGVLYTIREDLQEFQMTASFNIQETTPDSLQVSYGGTKDSAGTTLTMDGTAPPYKQFIFESCFSDTLKVFRIVIPKGRNTEPQDMSVGETHLVHGNLVKALPDITDTTTLPTMYVEA